MARRQRSSPFEDLISIVARLPWWACLLLGGVVLRTLAAPSALQAVAQPGDIAAVAAQAKWKTFTLACEFVVPIACLVAAAISGHRQHQCRALVSGLP